MRKKEKQKPGCLGSLVCFFVRSWNWIFSIFCLTAPIAYGFHFCSFLFLFAGILSLPIIPIRNIWYRLPNIIRRLKGILVAVIFFIGIMIAPAPEEAPETLAADISTVTATTAVFTEESPKATEHIYETTIPIEVTTAITEATEAIEVMETTAATEHADVSSIVAASHVEPTLPSETEDVPVPLDNSTFNIHFIDVGQADAALVECDGHYMLIDGGNKADSNVIYSVLKKAAVPNLDIIVGTHAHEDHIGGLPGALNYTTADLVLCPVTSYDSEAFEDFARYAEKNGNGIIVPDIGDTYSLGSSTVTILGLNAGNNTNDTSIVLRIDYASTSFLFTGDGEREAEQAILGSGANLSATVMKVGHHGSDSSTTYPFLREIMPKYAVISVGEDNSYGHPTEDTLSKLRDADVTVFRTDMQGDIYCTSNGETVTFSVQKNANADTLAPMVKETEPPATTAPVTQEDAPKGTDYVLNANTRKFHYPSCRSVKQMKESNKVFFTGTRDEVIAKGYKPCGNCHP